MVAAELAFCVAKSGSAHNRQALEVFLAPLTILPFDHPAAWAYGDLRAVLERRGTPIGSLDTMIAAHALSLQARLITSNTREFAKVPEDPSWSAAGQGLLEALRAPCPRRRGHSGPALNPSVPDQRGRVTILTARIDLGHILFLH